MNIDDIMDLLYCAIRLLNDNYNRHKSAGKNTCKHSIPNEFACRACDEEKLRPYASYECAIAVPLECIGHRRHDKPVSLPPSVFGHVHSHDPIPMIRPFDFESSTYNLETIELSIRAFNRQHERVPAPFGSRKP